MFCRNMHVCKGKTVQTLTLFLFTLSQHCRRIRAIVGCFKASFQHIFVVKLVHISPSSPPFCGPIQMMLFFDSQFFTIFGRMGSGAANRDHVKTFYHICPILVVCMLPCPDILDTYSEIMGWDFDWHPCWHPIWHCKWHHVRSYLIF